MDERNIDKGGQYVYGGLIVNGFLMLALSLIGFGACVWWALESPDSPVRIIPIVLGIAMLCLLPQGFFVQQPNQSRVMIFFGKYCGTFFRSGFYWNNPFVSRTTISLRLRNMDVAPIKVNDKTGNPVMIGMVLVWRVDDTYRAVFDIDDTRSLDNFVSIQSDAALREVTSHYAYDSEDAEENEVTLRSGSHEINSRIEEKLNERLAMAGIEIVEARLNYLAYAPEIAAVMLRRQQASAIISAREKIVEGAVSMVRMAVDELEEQNVVKLDPQHKATLVSNLLVVLCADDPAQPVVNTGATTV